MAVPQPRLPGAGWGGPGAPNGRGWAGTRPGRAGLSLLPRYAEGSPDLPGLRDRSRVSGHGPHRLSHLKRWTTLLPKGSGLLRLRSNSWGRRSHSDDACQTRCLRVAAYAVSCSVVSPMRGGGEHQLLCQPLDGSGDAGHGPHRTPTAGAVRRGRMQRPASLCPVWTSSVGGTTSEIRIDTLQPVRHVADWQTGEPLGTAGQQPPRHGGVPAVIEKSSTSGVGNVGGAREDEIPEMD